MLHNFLPRQFRAKGSLGGTIAANTFWLGVAEVVSRLLKLGLVIFAARQLGATEYGVFAFALAFVGLFVFIADFGLNQIVTREFARDRKREKHISAILSLKLVLSVVAVTVVLGVSLVATTDAATRAIMWVLAGMMVLHSIGELFFAVLRARQQMQYESVTRMVESALVATLGVAALLSVGSVVWLAWAYFVASVVATVGLLVFFHLRIHTISVQFDIKLWKKFLKLSWPLAFVGIFALIYNQIDSVMMGLWGQLTETGWYNAAYKVVTGALLPATLLAHVFFPGLSVAVQQSKKKLQQLWDGFLATTFVVAIPIVVGGLVLAERIILFAFDASYAPSVFAFQILIVMAGIVYLNGALGRLLVASDMQFKNFWITFWGALVNIAFNLVLIPRFSLYGAAIATLITFTVIFLLFMWEVRRAVPVRIVSKKSLHVLLAVIMATLMMYGALLVPQVANLHVIFQIAIASVVYGIALVAITVVVKFSTSSINKA